MADDRLRALERRWKETGAAEDEAAWLREQVRHGDLPAERLRLAAYLGHEPALRVAGDAGVIAVGDWLGPLGEHGREACVRVGLAAARAGRLALAAEPARAVIEAAEAWLICPCGRHEALAFDRSVAAWDVLCEEVDAAALDLRWHVIGQEDAASLRREYRREIASQPASARALRDLIPFADTGGASDDMVALVVRGGAVPGALVEVHLTWHVESDPAWPATGRVSLAAWVEDSLTDSLSEALRPAVAATSAAVWLCAPGPWREAPVFPASVPVAYAGYGREQAEVLRAIRADVVPWALGRGDPVRDRVAAREGSDA